jgi:hypothetical protein
MYIYSMIRLRCHKKKRKRCREESNLLPDNGTYTSRRDTTFVFQYINTQYDRHGGRGTVRITRTTCNTWRAAFLEWYGQRPQWSVGSQLHSVVSLRTQVTWRTPTRKSLEASSSGNSRAMGWVHHGRTSDCCICRLNQWFSIFMRPRPGKFFLYKTRALYSWCQGPAVEKRCCKHCRDFRGLWIMACRMSSFLSLSRTLPPVWGIVRPFSRSMYYFTMSRRQGTWWQMYWRRKAR